VNLPAAPPRLSAARLELRAHVAGDAEALFAILSDAQAMRYWSAPPMAEVTEAAALVARAHEHAASGLGLRWAVCAREGGAVIGSVSLFRFDAQNARAEIGYILGRPWWGRGLMREALTAVIDFAFGELDLRRIEADTDPRNEASVGLLERLGFVREGLLRERWVVAGEVSDSAYLGLLRRDWLATRPGAR
jgi:RimJ/RimL family protein N-acetyltransferase